MSLLIAPICSFRENIIYFIIGFMIGYYLPILVFSPILKSAIQSNNQSNYVICESVVDLFKESDIYCEY